MKAELRISKYLDGKCELFIKGEITELPLMIAYAMKENQNFAASVSAAMAYFLDMNHMQPETLIEIIKKVKIKKA